MQGYYYDVDASYHVKAPKFREGMKFSASEDILNLNGMTPCFGMEISITKGGQLSCVASPDDLCRFIGNVVEDTSLLPYGKYYSIYVVSIEELFGERVNKKNEEV